MNLLLTNYCNKQCPYCFARDKLVPAGSARRRVMTLEDLSRAIAFVKRSRQRHVNIMGGEPTLHPGFKKAVSLVIREGLTFTLFTNGLMNEDNARFLKNIGDTRCTVVLNINAPESYTRQEWSVINRTMKIFGDKRLTLGFTVYRPDFSLDFCVGLIRKYGLNTWIRLGIAVPVVGGKNSFLKLTDYPRVSERLVRFIEDYRTEGIRFAFDCGFVFCSFSDGQLGRLYRSGVHLASFCVSAVDVGPDLSVWRCFSCSLIVNRKLSDFRDLKSTVTFYEKKFSAFRKAGTLARCLGCGQRKTGICSGGCLGHTLKTFKFEDKMKI